MKKIAILLIFCFISHGAAMDINKTAELEKIGAYIEKDPKYPPVIKYKLKNGLTLLMLEKHFVPTISFTTMFKVGNVDNIQGKSGLAHLFEHMAFKGNQIIGTSNYKKEEEILEKIEKVALVLNSEDKKSDKDEAKIKKLKEELENLQKEAEKYIVREEYWKIYNKLGQSNMNAFTSTDYTGYIVSLPSNRLESWMIIESERFQRPVLRDFYKERNVVLEELRMNQADPNRVMWQTLLSNAFVAHPYRNPTIGWEDDVSHLTKTDAENFYKKFYIPNNCTIAIVGDIDPLETIKLTEKYFSSWKEAELPDTNYTLEPPQNSEKIIRLFFNAKPAIKIGYKIPQANHLDIPALIVASEILANGKTSRLYKELVDNKKIALYVNGYVGFPGDRYPSLLIIQSAPKQGTTNEQLDKEIMNIIDELKNNPPTQWELEKVINNYEIEIIKGLESNPGFSHTLASNQQILGDWKYSWNLLDKIKELTPQDISDAVKKYFNSENKTAVYLIEKK